MKMKIGNNWYDTRSTEIECSPALGHSHDGPNNGVKTISINNGDPISPDKNGNVDIPVAAVTGTGLSNDLTATISVGGVQSGDTFEMGTSTEEVLRKLLVKEVAPSISITLNPAAGIYHKGEPVLLKSVSYTVNPGTASALSSLSISDGRNKLVEIVDVKNGSKTLSNTYTANTEFTGTLMYLDKSGTPRSLTTKANYTFLDYSYMGAISTGLSANNIPAFAEDALPIIESKLTAANIKGLTKKLLATAANEYNFTTNVGEFMVYAYPASYGNLSEIWDSNYRLADFETNNKLVTIDGVSYKVYYSGIVELSNYKVEFKK